MKIKLSTLAACLEHGNAVVDAMVPDGVVSAGRRQPEFEARLRALLDDDVKREYVRVSLVRLRSALCALGDSECGE